MARRMFSTDIVCSDAFLDMSPSGRDLYYQLCMFADDDGFVGSPKKIMRILGTVDDDFKILIAKRFILRFESGVVVVKHWLIHNSIRRDLYKETNYKKEKSQLGFNDNGAYTEIENSVSEIKRLEPPDWLNARRAKTYRKRHANGTQTARKRHIGKVSKGKDRLGKDRLGKDRLVERETPPHPLKKENSLDYLRTLPQESIEEFTSKFDINREQLLIQAEKLASYCEAHNKKYSNYKAMLNNSLLKDYKKRGPVVPKGQSLYELAPGDEDTWG